MLVVSGIIPEFIINKEAIDDILIWSECTHKQYCERVGFDYGLFERVYNNDLSITIEQLISFADCLNRPLRDFVAIV
ncbi:MAG: hypothetical protein IJA72_01290 [Clostridia bacterium]|nr:hypothetical protein [Clostridia bacterium]